MPEPRRGSVSRLRRRGPPGRAPTIPRSEDRSLNRFGIILANIVIPRKAVESSSERRRAGSPGPRPSIRGDRLGAGPMPGDPRIQPRSRGKDGRRRGPSRDKETVTMDATRVRRTRDRVRQLWYARQRQRRFARFLGFASEGPAGQSLSARPIPRSTAAISARAAGGEPVGER